MPSLGPHGKSPHRQWHFLPKSKASGVMSKSSDSCTEQFPCCCDPPLFPTAHALGSLSAHQSFQLPSGANLGSGIQLLWNGARKGKCPKPPQTLAKKSCAWACQDLLNKDFLFGGTMTTFTLCISNAALNVSGNQLILGETNWTEQKKTENQGTQMPWYIVTWTTDSAPLQLFININVDGSISSIFQHENAQFHPCKTHPRILGILIPSKWLSLQWKRK